MIMSKAQQREYGNAIAALRANGHTDPAGQLMAQMQAEYQKAQEQAQRQAVRAESRRAFAAPFACVAGSMPGVHYRRQATMQTYREAGFPRRKSVFASKGI